MIVDRCARAGPVYGELRELYLFVWMMFKLSVGLKGLNPWIEKLIFGCFFSKKYNP